MFNARSFESCGLAICKEAVFLTRDFFANELLKLQQYERFEFCRTSARKDTVFFEVFHFTVNEEKFKLNCSVTFDASKLSLGRFLPTHIPALVPAVCGRIQPERKGGRGCVAKQVLIIKREIL